jgi:hypothetical protein
MSIDDTNMPRREPLQRLADRRAADAQLVLQRLLAHHVAGREFEPDDHPADLGVRPCTQRFRRDTFMIYQIGRTRAAKANTP